MSASPRSITHHPLSGHSRLVCNICRKQFSRLEHLRRHDQVHIKDKSYKCRHCEKTFARKDAVKRHENSHKPVNSTERPTASRTAFRRSCSTCARSRIKCTGGNPCCHCVAKNLCCTYLPRKAKPRHYVLTNDVTSAEMPSPDIASINPADTSSLSELVEHSIQSQDDTGTTLPYTVYSGEDTDGAGDVGQPSPVGSMILPQLACQDFNARDTNWLPFEPSSTGDMGSFVMNDAPSQYAANLNASALISADANILDGPHYAAAPVEDPSSILRYDRVSALITSMRTGLPGFSQTDSKSETSENNGCLARLYADGAGARASQSDRHIFQRRRIHSVSGAAVAPPQGSVSSWIETLQTKAQTANERGELRFAIPDAVFQELLSKINPQQFSFSFSIQFLSHMEFLMQKEILELLIQLYFDNFHPVYPFLDRSLLCIPVWGWSLCLATAAIGARFLYTSDITAFGDRLCSFLHEILLKELDFGHIEDSLPYLQARVLITVGLSHSRESSLMNCGYNAASLVYNSCLRLRLLEEDDRIGIFQPGQDLEQVWIAWRFRETRRRTGLFIWTIDCSLAFMTQTSPRLPLKLLKLKLPSSDELWEADTCETWLRILRRGGTLSCDPKNFNVEEESRISLQDAVRRLWTELHVSGPATPFGRITLISMLVRRIWDAVWYLDDPNRQNGLLDSSTLYLATIPEFTRWRNGTCDCLDVLHWEALSISAKAGGVESPVILHLHLARLMILTPIRELFGHIHAKRGSVYGFLLPHDLYDVPESDLQCQQALLTWVHKDKYKARLAVIHAGAIFWHVRRYSSDSFLQPFTVCLAAITLWAYGRYANIGGLSRPIQSGEPSSATDADLRAENNTSVAVPVSSLRDCIEGQSASTTGQNQTSSIRSPGSALPSTYQRMPGLLQLDRPIDDELVQHFIRAGEGITLFLEGVPDLCSEQGTDQILREAILILNEFANCWNISCNYATFLDQFLSRG